MHHESELLSIDYAKKLDEQDPLKAFRDEFYTRPGTIYLDGNSLGLLSKRAESALLSVMDMWKCYGIDGWTQGEHPWFYLSEKLGEMTAPLIGTETGETIVTGSTTINLHQLAATFFKPEGAKNKILADELNFPTDLYALQSQLRLHGLDPEEHLVLIASKDGETLNEEDIIAQMTEDIALILLPGVLYRSGQLLDMARLTNEAHKRGIIIGFDLCHSIGSVPHALSDWGVDFAFWCSYKHLNGGPGAVAGIYVNKRHFDKVPGLTGWFGSDKERQFDLAQTFTPSGEAGAYQIGTPHVLSTAPLIGSLSMFLEAGIENVREKSLRLTNYCLMLIEANLSSYGFTVGTPMEPTRRGGHILLKNPEAARICKALKENHIIPDFRAPDGIRLAPVALYNTFTEVWKTIERLKRIMDEGQYKKFENKRDVVA